MRKITYVEAIREATQEVMRKDKDVVLIGEGVPDPKSVFGTTKGLREEFGHTRVLDMPVSENGMTGICIGAAVQGLKPILVHQRIDFSLYAFDQIVNNAAKWHSMYGGRAGHVPMVVRCIIGRGWGQGNQHSQSLSHIYATIPGLKVITPSNARDAKELFIAAVEDPNPVMFIEHRWLHNTESLVPDEVMPGEIGKAGIAREGSDLTIVAWSYMVIEALKAAEFLSTVGIDVEIVDLKTIRPLDIDTVKKSVSKTRRIVVLEEAWRFNSLSGEIITQIVEDPDMDGEMLWTPKRITLPDCYAPSTPHLTQYFYPTQKKIVKEILNLLGRTNVESVVDKVHNQYPHDIPDQSFKGPF